MHSPTSCLGVASATARPLAPGSGTKRFSALALFSILVGSALPSFAQNYVTQYTAAFGPTGVALDNVGGVTYLYVADESHGNVVKINVATGATAATFGVGSQGNAPGQFGRPYGIAVDPASHDLYVAERMNGRVQRINSTTGASVMLWGTNDAAFDSSGQNVNPPNPTSPQGHFQEPIGVAADSAGNVYVVDHGNNRVQKFLVHQVSGTWTVDNVAMWGTTGSGNGQFDHPYGAALDSAGNLLVADGLNGRVEKFDSTGNFLSTVGSKGTGPGQFIIATWVSFDPSGALWVTSTNSDPQASTASDINSQWVSKFTASGAFVSRFGGSFGSGPGQFDLPFDVAVDANNRAYVSDYYNTRVQVFDLNTPSAGTGTGGSGGTSGTGSTSGTGTTSGRGTTTSSGSTTGTGTTTGTGSSTGTGTTTGSTTGTGTTAGTGSGTTTGSGSTSGTGAAGGNPPPTVGTTIMSATVPADGTYSAGDALQFTIRFSGPVSLKIVAADKPEKESGASSDNGKGEGKGNGGDDHGAGGNEHGGTSSAGSTVTTGSTTVAGNDDAQPGNSDVDSGLPFVAWTAVAAAGQPADRGDATYVSGSGTNSLVFEFHVHGNDQAPHGIMLGTTVQLPVAVIVDGSGQVLNASQLTIPWPSNPLVGVILVPANQAKHDNDDGAGSTAPTTSPGSIGSATFPTAAKSDKPTRLVNLSSRLQISGGDSSHAVAVGFVVSGSTPPTVLIRAVGPGLRAFGITDALPNPTLQVQDAGGHLVVTNGGWANNSQVSAAAAAAGAFALQPGSGDSAVVVTLAPGAYTATVGGNGTSSGLALVEIYDTATNSSLNSPQLVNISTRGFVSSGGNMIVGFVVRGDSPKRVLVRAVGPGLTVFGVSGALSDPILQLDTASGTTIAQSNDWGTPESLDSRPAASVADVIAAETAAGAFPLVSGSKDAAVIATLDPGAYSAVVTGVNNSSGAALVEVYELPSP